MYKFIRIEMERGGGAAERVLGKIREMRVFLFLFIYFC